MNVKEAVELLVCTLESDEEYRISWHANLSMAFQDTYRKYEGSEVIKAVADEATDNFLNLLCSDAR